VVDILQVLEGATYLAFIVGAIVAVYELRDIKKDRRLDVLMRMEEMTVNREFKEANCKIWRSKETTAEGLEKDVSVVDLTMVADYNEFLAELVTEGKVDLNVAELFPFAGLWEKISPWIKAVRVEVGVPDMWGDFEKIAKSQAAGLRK